jgi:hypothetical protein
MAGKPAGRPHEDQNTLRQHIRRHHRFTRLDNGCRTGRRPIAGGCAIVAATFVDRMRVAVGASKPADAGIRRGP